MDDKSKHLGFGEQLGPWTHQHSLGAVVVILMVLGIAANIWPGWQRLGEWLA
jgi:hypothetical protein